MDSQKTLKALAGMNAWDAPQVKEIARAAGYSLSDARAAGYSLSDAIAAGYSLSDARAAGYSLSIARAAGYSLSDAIAAGYSLSDAIAAGYEPDGEWESIPALVNPYTRLLADIKQDKRIHKQSVFGPDYDPAENLCGTPMCTAGHLVNMAGAIGYDLQRKYGWEGAAYLIHKRAHPDLPAQNFGGIPQATALAYIEWMAEQEKQAQPV